MKNRTTRRICLTALMAAIIYVFTAYIHVPSHTGYTHVGDGFLYLAASLLPAPFAAAAGAIGAGLADLLSGYGIWAPGTVIIKVLTAFCFTNRREKLVNKRNVRRWCFASAGIISMRHSSPETSPRRRSAFRGI